MSKIKLTGSNSGYVEISSAADAGNLTLNLPTSGSALLSNGDNVYTGITTFSNDLKLEGGSYDVLWDSSDNQLEFGDNAKLSFGASSDLQIFHDGNNSFIKNTTGQLQVQADNFGIVDAAANAYNLFTYPNAQINLYYAGAKKFETTNTGTIVTGICTATSFSGSGEALTRTTQYSHRNVIVNGAMLVAQRGTSSTAIADVGAYGSVDRFQMVGANLDQLAMLQKQTSDGPDGFSKCFEFDVTTPENALDANDLVYMRYLVEGQDLEPFFNANGTGKNFTLSFYVKAYQAGTYQLNIYKSDGPRFITRTYTIASSGVWQRVVLNFPGDTNTTGMLATTGSGFNIAWIFAAGTNYTSGSQSTNWGGWPGNPGFAAGHAVNSASSANNYFRITGVQLELGDIATPFEHLGYGESLRRCERYFQCMKGPSSVTGGTGERCYGVAHTYSSSRALWSFQFKTEMRSAPTVSIDTISDIQVLSASAWNSASSFVTTNNFHKFGGRVDLNFSGTPFTANGAGEVRILNDGVLGFDAEL